MQFLNGMGQVVMKVPQQVALTTLKGQVRAVVGVPITTKKHKITFSLPNMVQESCEECHQ